MQEVADGGSAVRLNTTNCGDCVKSQEILPTEVGRWFRSSLQIVGKKFLEIPPTAVGGLFRSSL